MTPPPEPNDPTPFKDAPSFAEVLVSRLRASCTPKAAPYPSQAKVPDSSVDTDLEDDLLPEMEPAEAAPPATLPARRLLTCLRLAATFVSEEALEPLRLRGAVTILRGIDVSDLPLIMEGLKTALPDHGWRVVAPSVSEDAVSKTSAERFLREIDRSLDTMAPVLILLPFDIALPAHLQQPGVASFTYAPISGDILLGFLEAMDRAPEDAGAFRSALPEPTILARLDTAQAAAALRFGSGLDLAERLEALTGPNPNGPRLEEGFSDSPVVQAARRVVADFGAWRRGEIGWSDFSHSLLLYGPPGTGKTMLARAMGNSAGIAFVTGSFAEWQAAGHLGDMLREMRRTFAWARRKAPAILFIDEIDAMGSRTGDDRHNQNYRVQVINGFLGDPIADRPAGQIAQRHRRHRQHAPLRQLGHGSRRLHRHFNAALDVEGAVDPHLLGIGRGDIDQPRNHPTDAFRRLAGAHQRILTGDRRLKDRAPVRAVGKLAHAQALRSEERCGGEV